jgi:hypothetical protein
MSHKTRQRAANEGACMPGRGDIRIVEHAMTVPAQEAVMARLRLGKHRKEPFAVSRRDLSGTCNAEPAERSAHRLDVDRVRHDRVINGEWARPCR